MLWKAGPLYWFLGCCEEATNEMWSDGFTLRHATGVCCWLGHLKIDRPDLSCLLHALWSVNGEACHVQWSCSFRIPYRDRISSSRYLPAHISSAVNTLTSLALHTTSTPQSQSQSQSQSQPEPASPLLIQLFSTVQGLICISE